MTSTTLKQNHEKLHTFLHWELIGVEPQEYLGELYPEMGVILTFRDHENTLHKSKRTEVRVLFNAGMGFNVEVMKP